MLEEGAATQEEGPTATTAGLMRAGAGKGTNSKAKDCSTASEGKDESKEEGQASLHDNKKRES